MIHCGEHVEKKNDGRMRTKIYCFPLCSDYNRNFTDVNSAIEIAAAGPGVYKAIWLLMLAFVVYLTLTIFTFGMKVPCGLFIPSLCLGAIMGRIVGIGKQRPFYKTQPAFEATIGFIFIIVL